MNSQAIFSKIVPVKPEVKNVELSDKSSKLFDYSVSVSGWIVNRGGDGIVVVEADCFQDDNRYTKTKRVSLLAQESQPFEIIFDEVTLLGGEYRASVKAYPLGK